MEKNENGKRVAPDDKSSKSVKQKVETKVQLRAYFDASDAALIVGKQGDRLKLLRETGAEVYVSQTIRYLNKSVVGIRGTPEIVSQVCGLIVRYLNDEPLDRVRSEASLPIYLTFVLPVKVCAAIIGEKGRTIGILQNTSRARIKMRRIEDEERTMDIIGYAETIQIAAFYICEIILKEAAAAPAVLKEQARLTVSTERVRRIIGQKGSKISELRVLSGAVIEVENTDDPNHTVLIWGTSAGTKLAVYLLEQIDTSHR